MSHLGQTQVLAAGLSNKLKAFIGFRELPVVIHGTGPAVCGQCEGNVRHAEIMPEDCVTFRYERWALIRVLHCCGIRELNS